MRRGWILFAVVLGSGVVFLDGTVVNVALQTIGQDLPASALGRLEGLTYVASGYFVVLAHSSCSPARWGTAFGRRRVFGIGSWASAPPRSSAAWRPRWRRSSSPAAQGAAGALLVPQSLAIITAAWDGEERGRAIGIWAAATSAITIAGPLVGGLLVQTVSWRAVFLVNVPIVALGAYALRTCPNRATSTRRGDSTGSGRP